MLKRLCSLIIAIILFAVPCFSYSVQDEFNVLKFNSAYSKATMDNLQAKAAILIDIDSGRVIFEKNPDEKLPLASVTKVMTSLIIMEALDSGKIKLDDKIPATLDAIGMGGSEVYLREGEIFPVDDMLKAIFVHSANDVCVAMADYLYGSEAAFVNQMNKRAKELGMTNTTFLDCTGLTDDGHFSTAKDISIMSRELILKHPKSIEYSQIWMDTFRDGKFRLDNTNKLVKYYTGTTGLKTGYTDKAGNCISASAKKGDTHILAVVLGEPDTNTRFGEVKRMFDHAFANYKKEVVVKKGEETGKIQVLNGVKTELKVYAKEQLSTILKDDEKTKVIKNNRLDVLNAPIEPNQKVGEMVLTLEGKEIGKVDLISQEKLEKASFIRLVFRKLLAIFGISI